MAMSLTPIFSFFSRQPPWQRDKSPVATARDTQLLARFTGKRVGSSICSINIKYVWYSRTTQRVSRVLFGGLSCFLRTQTNTATPFGGILAQNKFVLLSQCSSRWLIGVCGACIAAMFAMFFGMIFGTTASSQERKLAPAIPLRTSRNCKALEYWCFFAMVLAWSSWQFCVILCGSKAILSWFIVDLLYISMVVFGLGIMLYWLPTCDCILVWCCSGHFISQRRAAIIADTGFRYCQILWAIFLVLQIHGGFFCPS